MIYAGSDHQTADELKSALYLAESPEQIRTSLAYFVQAMEDWQKQDTINELDSHNALWFDKSNSIRSDYSSAFEKDLHGEIRPCKFRTPDGLESAINAINAWISKYSRGKVPLAVDQNDVNVQTVALLTNVLWFHGKWADPFDSLSTRPDEFERVPYDAVITPMMHKTAIKPNGFRLMETADYQVLEAPYGNRVYSMLILLPRDADRLPEIIANLDTVEIATWNSALIMPPVGIYIVLPRINFESRFPFKSILQAQGARAVFGSGADLSRMFSHSGAWVQDIKQLTKIEVEEKGTVVVAVTSGTFVISGHNVEPKPITFLADHPFLFLIRHNATGAILFMGCVMDPTAE
jgi:serpin B